MTTDKQTLKVTDSSTIKTKKERKKKRGGSYVTYRVSESQYVRERDFWQPGGKSMLVNALAGEQLSRSY